MTRKNKLAYMVILAIITILTACCLFGCNSKEKLSLDIPDEVLKCDPGYFSIPSYEVKNEKGEYMSGYKGTLVKVLEPNGNSYVPKKDAVSIKVEEGIYILTFSCLNTDIKDVEVKLDVKDRTAPTFELFEELPKNLYGKCSYKIPTEYAFFGDRNMEKTYFKLFHVSEDEKETEIELDYMNGKFTVTQTSGKYKYLFHSEDDNGNVLNKEYFVPVSKGIVNYEENKLFYADEDFGLEQLELNRYLAGQCKVERSTEQKYENESSSIKLTVERQGSIIYNFKNTTFSDVSNYDYLIMRIYNTQSYGLRIFYDSKNKIIAQPGEWTDIKVKTKNLEDSKSIFPDSFHINILHETKYEDGQFYPKDGVVVYLSNLYALNDIKEPVNGVVKDKIFYADDPYGEVQSIIAQSNAPSIKTSLSTEQKYKDEKGSFKLEVTRANFTQTNQYSVWWGIEVPYIVNLKESGYDGIVFRVYNDNKIDLRTFLQCHKKIGPLTLKAHKWTEIKVNVEDLKDTYQTNLSKYYISFQRAVPVDTQGENTNNKWALPEGTKIYISSMYGYVNPKPENIVKDKIFYADDKYGASQVTMSNYNAPIIQSGYSTEQKYMEEKGSFKIAVTGNDTKTNVNWSLSAPYIKNLREQGYTSIVFRIYNACETDILFHRQSCNWVGLQTAKAKQWTEFNIKLDELKAGVADNLTGFNITFKKKMKDGSTGFMKTGDSIYISSMYGVK